MTCLRVVPMLCFFATLSVASLAHGEPEWGSAVTVTSRARVLLPDCEPSPFNVDELIASLRLELLGCGLELVTDMPTGREESVLVQIEAPRCSANALSLRIMHESLDAPAEREVDLSDRPERDRSRLLALSIAELYRTSRTAPAPDPSPASSPSDVETPSAATQPSPPQIDEEALRRAAVDDAVEEIERRREAARWPDHRVRLGLDAVLTAHPVHDSALFGGRLLVDIALSPQIPIHLGVDASFRDGGGSDTLGMVHTLAAAGALALRYEGGSRRIRGAVGPRIELGWSRIEGEPGEPGWEPGRADGFLLTLTLDGAFFARLSRRVWVVAGLGLGYVLVGLDASALEHHVGGVAGPSISASLGLAFGL